jgi:hypothetical protein
MPFLPRLLTEVISVVVLAGCTTHRFKETATPDERCFEGAAYGFVDTLAAPAAPRGSSKMWLILEPDILNGGPERRAKTIVVRDSSFLTASWKLVGDSIVVKHMTFPPAEWVLHETGTALRGRLHTETDNISTDAKGRAVKYRGDWPAVLSKIDCGSVAQPSNTR